MQVKNGEQMNIDIEPSNDASNLSPGKSLINKLGPANIRPVSARPMSARRRSIPNLRMIPEEKRKLMSGSQVRQTAQLTALVFDAFACTCMINELVCA